jgi:hypothetical protein
MVWGMGNEDWGGGAVFASKSGVVVVDEGLLQGKMSVWGKLWSGGRGEKVVGGVK